MRLQRAPLVFENCDIPIGFAQTKARFVLEGATCVVLEHKTGTDRGQIGSLTLGDRRYIVIAVANAKEKQRPDLVQLLSPRELEVAFHVAAGNDCKMVARRLRISFHTVRVHVGRIYAKLGLHKQTELAALIADQFGTQD